jgi:hypothetical protein
MPHAFFQNQWPIRDFSVEFIFDLDKLTAVEREEVA